jgi:hypothetical protein
VNSLVEYAERVNEDRLRHAVPQRRAGEEAV